MAVSEVGLSPKEFWSLTWFEWGLYILKLHKDRQKELARRELLLECTRQILTLHHNLTPGITKTVVPQDFWRLSYDSAHSNNDRPIEEVTSEAIRRFKETKALLGSKIKKGDGN